MRLPRRVSLLLSVTLWPAIIGSVHGVLPWAASRLTRRVGWWDGRPGAWNWPGLLLVAAGTAGVLWFWLVHMRRVAAQSQMELQLTPEYLVTEGPYRFSRNPMYVAVLIVWLGWAVWYGSWLLLAAVVLWWLVLNFAVIPREERGLAARHQERYRQYASSVPRWI